MFSRLLAVIEIMLSSKQQIILNKTNTEISTNNIKDNKEGNKF